MGFAYDLGWISFRFLGSQPDIFLWLQLVTAATILCVILLANLSTPAPTPSQHESKETNAVKKKQEAKEKVNEKELFAGLLLIVFACAGHLAAGAIHSPTGTLYPVLPLVATGALSVLSALWTFGSYRVFTRIWAKSVYENYLLFSPPQKCPPE